MKASYAVTKTNRYLTKMMFGNHIQKHFEKMQQVKQEKQQKDVSVMEQQKRYIKHMKTVLFHVKV